MYRICIEILLRIYKILTYYSHMFIIVFTERKNRRDYYKENRAC